MSTLLFAQRIKKVQLNAKKKEIVDTDALLERYGQEIDELKNRLSGKEAEAPEKTRTPLRTRATGREQGDERPQHAYQAARQPHPHKPTDEKHEEESCLASSSEVDLDMTPYPLQ